MAGGERNFAEPTVLAASSSCGCHCGSATDLAAGDPDCAAGGDGAAGGKVAVGGMMVGMNVGNAAGAGTGGAVADSAAEHLSLAACV